MKKLSKSNLRRQDTIEAYYCGCGCKCECGVCGCGGTASQSSGQTEHFSNMNSDGYMRGLNSSYRK